ncbi:MAG: hypothetical protein WCF85_12100 [Rhodospirillaceae bacterium]
MAAPARRPSAGTDHTDEAVDILRRLEPLLTRIDAEQRRLADIQRQQGDIQRQQGEDITDIKARLNDISAIQRKQGEDIAEQKGRLTEISARIPTIWTFATMIISLFGASFVLIRYASGH